MRFFMLVDVATPQLTVLRSRPLGRRPVSGSVSVDPSSVSDSTETLCRLLGVYHVLLMAMIEYGQGF